MTILHHPPQNASVGRNSCLIPDPRIPCQDYREGQPQKTLAYAQALQYWSEKANLPKPDKLHLLAICIYELRHGPWGLLPPSLDGAVFGGTTPRPGILEEGAAKLSTMETTQTPVLERRPTTSPERLTTLSAEEPDILATSSGELATVPTRELASPPTPLETDKKVRESPAPEFPGWTEVHPSWPGNPSGMGLLKFGQLKVVLPESQF